MCFSVVSILLCYLPLVRHSSHWFTPTISAIPSFLKEKKWKQRVTAKENMFLSSTVSWTAFVSYFSNVLSFISPKLLWEYIPSLSSCLWIPSLQVYAATTPYCILTAEDSGTNAAPANVCVQRSTLVSVRSQQISAWMGNDTHGVRHRSLVEHTTKTVNPWIPVGVNFSVSGTFLLTERSTTILNCFGLCWGHFMSTQTQTNIMWRVY